MKIKEIIHNWIMSEKNIDKKYSDKINNLIKEEDINDFNHFMSFLSLIDENNDGLKSENVINSIFDKDALYSFSYKLIDFFSEGDISLIDGATWVKSIREEIKKNKRFMNKSHLDIFNVVGYVKNNSVEIDLRESFDNQFFVLNSWMLDYEIKKIKTNIFKEIKKIQNTKQKDNEYENISKKELHFKYLEKKEKAEEYVAIVKRMRVKLEDDSLDFVIRNKREMTPEEKNKRLLKIEKYVIQRDEKIKEFENIKKIALSFNNDKNLNPDSKVEIDALDQTTESSVEIEFSKEIKEFGLEKEKFEEIIKDLEEDKKLLSKKIKETLISNKLDLDNNEKNFLIKESKLISEFELKKEKFEKSIEKLQKDKKLLTQEIKDTLDNNNSKITEKEGDFLIKESKLLRELEQRRIEFEEERDIKESILTKRISQVENQRLELKGEIEKLSATFKNRVNISSNKENPLDKIIIEKDSLINELRKGNKKLLNDLNKVNLNKEESLKLAKKESIKLFKLQENFDKISKENNELKFINKEFINFKITSEKKLKAKQTKIKTLQDKYDRFFKENNSLKKENAKKHNKLKEVINLSNIEQNTKETKKSNNVKKILNSIKTPPVSIVKNINNEIDTTNIKSLSKSTVSQLTKYSKENNIKISRGIKKAELISLILNQKTKI